LVGGPVGVADDLVPEELAAELVPVLPRLQLGCWGERGGVGRVVLVLGFGVVDYCRDLGRGFLVGGPSFGLSRRWNLAQRRGRLLGTRDYWGGLWTRRVIRKDRMSGIPARPALDVPFGLGVRLRPSGRLDCL
jgi:hypothetical protein